MNIQDYEQDIQTYAIEITRYLISRGSHAQDAEDTVQDLYVKMLELDIFVAPSKLRSWMYSVAIRSYIDKYRRTQHYQKIIEELGLELPNFSQDEEKIDLEPYLHQLKPKEERLLRAYYYENKSTKELANLFKISLSKVKIDLYRSRKKLKKMLESDGYHSNL